MDGAFRKIDIDQYDEDVLYEEELYDADPRDPATVLADAKDKQSAVRSALSKCVSHIYWVTERVLTCILICRGDVAGALTTVLDRAPYGPNVDEAKVRPAPHSHTHPP
jgi:actin related protein 2/3 complex subunit 5